MWSILLCFFSAKVFAANLVETSVKFSSDSIEIFKFCWANRKTAGFAEEPHYFSLERFPEDCLRERMAKWERTRLRMKHHSFSWPFPKSINSNRKTNWARDLFYDEASFKAAVSQRLPESTFIAPESGLSTAHLSVLHNHALSLQMLLELHPSHTKATLKSSGTTPLHFAVLLDSYRCMEVLLKAGANCFVTDDEELSPLDLVLSKGDVMALSLFIMHGKILLHPALKKTAAYFIHAGKFRQAVLLIGFGADANIFDPSSEATLLELAGKLNDQLCVQVLQKHLSNTNVVVHATINGDLVALEQISIFSKARNYNGKCLLEWATLAKKTESFEFLLNNVPRLRNFGPYSRELKQIALTAATYGFIPALDFAFSKGLKPDSKFGDSCLLGHALESGQFTAADWMIQVHSGSVVDVRYKSLPILFHALFSRNRVLLKYLLIQFKPIINVNFYIMPLGLRALNFLIAAEDFDTVFWFLQQGADPNLPDILGNSAKLMALEHSDSKFRTEFLELCNKFGF